MVLAVCSRDRRKGNKGCISRATDILSLDQAAFRGRHHLQLAALENHGRGICL